MDHGVQREGGEGSGGAAARYPGPGVEGADCGVFPAARGELGGWVRGGVDAGGVDPEVGGRARASVDGEFRRSVCLAGPSGIREWEAG